MTSIQDQLAVEAAEAEARRDQPAGSLHRARTAPADQSETSQVYTVRMPVERLAELRQRAAELGVQPSTLMRQWVLERLDAEREHQSDLAGVRRHLADALTDLDRITRAAS